ncbi:hypothetical protein WG936_08195 [Corynebacterium sp. H127]|uniref:hypothetical protein n=1 Tax=Corynebacterium sp. H127 TaxID=3133418 RepID=UPI00309C73C6
METIQRIGEPVEDADGRIIDAPILGEFVGIVSPLGGGQFSTDTITDGSTKQLQVLAPAGTAVKEGDILRIRGLEYRVKEIPWDWSMNRRPVLARHAPKVQIMCDRKEA